AAEDQDREAPWGRHPALRVKSSLTMKRVRKKIDQMQCIWATGWGRTQKPVRKSRQPGLNNEICPIVSHRLSVWESKVERASSDVSDCNTLVAQKAIICLLISSTSGVFIRGTRKGSLSLDADTSRRNMART